MIIKALMPYGLIVLYRYIKNCKNQSRDGNKILEEINFSRPPLKSYMQDIHGRYDFKGKTVCEIGADINLECAQAAIKLGAKSVCAVNPNIVPEKSPHKRLTIIKDLGENLNSKVKFDLIYGVALLEHVLNPEDLARKVFELLKKNGKAYLQGNPFWTGKDGNHHWVTKNPSTRIYRFTDVDTVFDNWYHLTFPSKDDFAEYMLSKNVPQKDIIPLYKNVFEHPHISRLTPTEVIKAFTDVKEFDVDVFRHYAEDEPNEYYNIAKNKYTEEDLKTRGVTLLISRKKAN